MSMTCDNIRVSVRVKPECEPFLDSIAIEAVGNNGIQIVQPRATSSLSKRFYFDHVYWESNLESRNCLRSQEHVYNDIGQPVIANAMQGYNCSIFSYGQTGSGKTFTMFGIEEQDESLEGLIPRISKGLLNATLTTSTPTNNINTHFDPPEEFETQSQKTYTFKISYIDIYLEKVRDLLSDNDDDNKLRVREDPVFGTYVAGAIIREISSYEELKYLLLKGSARRASAVTKMNQNSSRSHAIFTILFTQTVIEDCVSVTKISKINLVDLAGSENSRTSGLNAARQKEAAYINKSLLTLGRVIQSLSKMNTSATLSDLQQAQLSADMDDNNRLSANTTGNTSPLLRTTKSNEDTDSLTEIISNDYNMTSSHWDQRRRQDSSSGYAPRGGSPVACGSGSGDEPNGNYSYDFEREGDVGEGKSSEFDTSSMSSITMSCASTTSLFPIIKGKKSNSSLQMSCNTNAGGTSGKSNKSNTGKAVIIPYRDSVLTYLLKESLGGNSKTTLIATVRSGKTFLEDTLSTLRYAAKAKTIVNVAAVNEDNEHLETIERLQSQVRRLESELLWAKRHQAQAQQTDGLKSVQTSVHVAERQALETAMMELQRERDARGQLQRELEEQQCRLEAQQREQEQQQMYLLQIQAYHQQQFEQGLLQQQQQQQQCVQLQSFDDESYFEQYEDAPEVTFDHPSLLVERDESTFIETEAEIELVEETETELVEETETELVEETEEPLPLSPVESEFIVENNQMQQQQQLQVYEQYVQQHSLQRDQQQQELQQLQQQLQVEYLEIQRELLAEQQMRQQSSKDNTPTTTTTSGSRGVGVVGEGGGKTVTRQSDSRNVRRISDTPTCTAGIDELLSNFFGFYRGCS